MANPGLALGTVQFGLDYGIKNTRGKVSANEVRAIIDLASREGVDCLDTAWAYGESESVLGAMLSGPQSFRIITKFPDNESPYVLPVFQQSLDRLKTDSVYGYMFHSFTSYQRNPTLFQEMLALKQEGRVKKIGFSLYNPDEWATIVHRRLPVDIVQVPCNILDQRFKVCFAQMKSLGVEIHVRSVFLQGLLLMPPETLAPHFASVINRLSEMHRFCRTNNVHPVALLLGLPWRIKEVDQIVIGVDSLEDFRANLSYFHDAQDSRLEAFDYDQMATDDLDILLPMNWKKK